MEMKLASPSGPTDLRDGHPAWGGEIVMQFEIHDSAPLFDRLSINRSIVEASKGK
jgi:hypothetical protein